MFDVEVTSTLGVGDNPLGIINHTTIATEDLAEDPAVRALARELSSWVSNARSYGQNTAGSMFDRGTYMPSDNPFMQMRSAKVAVDEDDIVSGGADITEGIAFKGGCHWESSSPEDEDVFNQIGAELELDRILRVLWREDYAYNQAVVAKLWDYRTFTVRGVTANGNRRKKRYSIYVPVRMVFLNPMHVVPIGWGPLREDRLAWQATDFEIGQQSLVSSGKISDPLMTSFFSGRYESEHPFELARFGKWGVIQSQLLEMKPGWVFRHAPLRPDYEAFAPLALRSAFADLDIKRQLMMSDRASLVGAANYLLLIRKGTDTAPAKPEEIARLQENYQFLAKVPVIISDHRLSIDIIAPKQDFVLQQAKYDVVDERILNRMLRSFAAPGRQSANADGSYYDVMCASIESRRQMIKRTLEKEIARAVVMHPRNAGIFESIPSLAFTPGGVKVGVNQSALSALLSLRTQREISRETILEVLGLDQSVEYQRVRYESDTYDDTFRTHIPFDGQNPGENPGTPGDTGSGTGNPGANANAPGNDGAGGGGNAPTPNGTPEAPGVSGARGGRPRGGGAGANSPAAIARPKTGNGNPSTKGL